MRKASIRNNHAQFEAKLDSLENLARRVLRPDAEFDAGDRSLFLEGLTLLLAGYWEELIDDDFVDALNRNTSQYAQNVGVALPKNLSRDVCFGLLVGYGYLDFRSVGELLRRSKDLLVPANNPFVNIPKGARPFVDDFIRVRNFLSHRSQRAYRAYANMLSTRYRYARIVSPGQFLRAQHGRGHPGLFHFVDVFRRTSESKRAAAPF